MRAHYQLNMLISVPATYKPDTIPSELSFPILSEETKYNEFSTSQRTLLQHAYQT